MGTFIKNHNSSKDEKLTFLDLTVSACLGSAVKLRGVTIRLQHIRMNSNLKNQLIKCIFESFKLENR